jgi:hypothetical protein
MTAGAPADDPAPPHDAQLAIPAIHVAVATERGTTKALRIGIARQRSERSASLRYLAGIQQSKSHCRQPRPRDGTQPSAAFVLARLASGPFTDCLQFPGSLFTSLILRSPAQMSFIVVAGRGWPDKASRADKKGSNWQW